MSKKKFINLLFALLMAMGIALITGATTLPVRAQECLVNCLYPTRCIELDGECIVTTIVCGNTCSPCVDPPCACYFYRGHCSRPHVIWNDVPQYNYCDNTCCDYGGYCLF